MDLFKYRHLYLNDFTMQKVSTPKPKTHYHFIRDKNYYLPDSGILARRVCRASGNHPLVNKRIAFWTGGQELCIGWILKHNPNIYRPIFSHKREKLINKVNKDIILRTNVDKIWKKAKSRFFNQLCLIKKLPTVVVMQIVEFTY